MMKIKTKRQISLGVLSAVAVISVPIATVASCGGQTPSQNVSIKKNQTTDTQTTQALKEQIAKLKAQLLKITESNKASEKILKETFANKKSELIKESVEKQKQIDKLKKESADKQNEIDNLSIQLKTSSDKLSIARDELIKSSNKLITSGIKLKEANDKLSKANDELTKAHDKLTKLNQQLTTLKNEKNKLIASKTTNLKQKEELKKLIKQIDKISSEKAALLIQRNALETERNNLQNEKNTLLKEKNDLADEKVKLETERNILQKQKDDLENKRLSLLKEKTQLEADKTQLESEKVKLEQDLKKALADKKTIEDKLKKSNSVFSVAKTSVMSVLSDIKNAAIKYFQSNKTMADKKILANDIDAAKVKTKATMQNLLSGPNSIIDSLLFAVNDPKISKYAKILKPFTPLITSMLTTLVDDLFTNIQNAVYYNPTWMSKETNATAKASILETFNKAMTRDHEQVRNQWFANEMAMKVMGYLQEIKKTKQVSAVQAQYFKKINDGWKIHLQNINTKKEWENAYALHIDVFQKLIQSEGNDITLTTLKGMENRDRNQFAILFETFSKQMTPAEFTKNKLIKSQKNDNDKTLEIFIKLASTARINKSIVYRNQIHNILLKTPDYKKHVYVDANGTTRITIDYSVRSLINVFNKMITYEPWTEGALIDKKAISALVLKVFGKNNLSLSKIASGGMGSIVSLIPKILDDLRNGGSTFENNLQPLFSILFGDKGKLVFELKPGDTGKYFDDYKWYSPQLQVFNSEYILQRKKHYITDADETQFFGALMQLVQQMMKPKP